MEFILEKSVIIHCRTNFQYEEEKHEKYLDQEGSLIEYCRLDHRENAKNQPNICVPSVVKCLSNRSTFVPADNFAQTVSKKSIYNELCASMCIQAFSRMQSDAPLHVFSHHYS